MILRRPAPCENEPAEDKINNIVLCCMLNFVTMHAEQEYFEKVMKKRKILLICKPVFLIS